VFLVHKETPLRLWSAGPLLKKVLRPQNAKAGIPAYAGARQLLKKKKKRKKGYVPQGMQGGTVIQAGTKN
jgi:hypothetical protein